jgi:hypothetical protein
VVGQDPGQFGSVGAGSLDPDGGDGTEAGQVGGDLPVPGTDRQEVLVSEVFSVIGYERDVVGVGVRVDAGNDFLEKLLIIETTLRPAVV